jgi:hypothetical protein
MTEEFWSDFRSYMARIGKLLADHGMKDKWYDINLRVCTLSGEDRALFREISVTESVREPEKEPSNVITKEDMYSC